MGRWSSQINRLLEKLKQFHQNDHKVASRELRWMLQSSTLQNLSSSKAQQLSMLEEMVQKRIISIPLAYAIGDIPFGKRSLKISPPVLIPRPETEYWVNALSNRLSKYIPYQAPDTKEREKKGKRLTILDLCTGNGCIPNMLADTLPSKSLDIIAIDNNPIAFQLANDNTQYLTELTDNHINIIETDIFSEDLLDIPQIKERIPFDLVISNPPYIPYHDWLNLDPSVKNWESPSALVSTFPSNDQSIQETNEEKEDILGLRFYKRIAEISSTVIHPTTGSIAVEISPNQAQIAEQIFRQSLGKSSDDTQIFSEVWQDQFDRYRTLLCHHSQSPLYPG